MSALAEDAIYEELEPNYLQIVETNDHGNGTNTSNCIQDLKNDAGDDDSCDDYI